MTTTRTNKSSGPGVLYMFAGWACQLALAYLAPLVAVIILSVCLGAGDDDSWTMIEYVLYPLLGVAAALLVSVCSPQLTGSGRWIWTMPLALFAFCVAWDASLGRSGVISTDLFGSGEASWVRSLVTMPAWSCCWYSAAMVARRWVLNHPPARPDPLEPSK